MKLSEMLMYANECANRVNKGIDPECNGCPLEKLIEFSFQGAPIRHDLAPMSEAMTISVKVSPCLMMLDMARQIKPIGAEDPENPRNNGLNDNDDLPWISK